MAEAISEGESYLSFIELNIDPLEKPMKAWLDAISLAIICNLKELKTRLKAVKKKPSFA